MLANDVKKRFGGNIALSRWLGDICRDETIAP